MMISQGQPIVGGSGLMTNQGQQQMVMMSGGNMVRIPQQGQQYMRMQDQGRMMHNPGNPGSVIIAVLRINGIRKILSSWIRILNKYADPRIRIQSVKYQQTP